MSDANLEQFLRDHPLREHDEDWNACVRVVAELIKRGQLFYNVQTGRLIKMSNKQ
jgi:hypothetical protein